MSAQVEIGIPLEMWTGRATEEGVVVNWFKSEGAAVRRGETVAEVMIEKVTIEVSSPADGVIARILVPQGGVVKPGQPLALVSVEAAAEAPKAEAAAEAPTSPKAETFVPATPAARRLARELGIELASVKPTGPGGRVTEEDVRRYHQETTAAPEFDVIPLAGIRKITAQRMMESLQRSAQLTLFMEADVSNLVAFKEGSTLPEGITYTDLLAKAVVRTLGSYPLLNAHLVEGSIYRFKAIHLGVAVALPEGLIVPVVRNAQDMPLSELSSEIHRLSQAARSGTLKPTEATGSTFTITNLGMYGIDFFTPILNPPEVAILGIGRIQRRLRPAEHGFEVYSVLPLSLTIDHQVVDGAVGAAFLKDLSALLASPQSTYV